jgi:hypothetical protein
MCPMPASTSSCRVPQTPNTVSSGSVLSGHMAVLLILVSTIIQPMPVCARATRSRRTTVLFEDHHPHCEHHQQPY